MYFTQFSVRVISEPQAKGFTKDRDYKVRAIDTRENSLFYLLINDQGKLSWLPENDLRGKPGIGTAKFKTTKEVGLEGV